MVVNALASFVCESLHELVYSVCVITPPFFVNVIAPASGSVSVITHPCLVCVSLDFCLGGVFKGTLTYIGEFCSVCHY